MHTHITRREAIERVIALCGGVALVDVDHVLAANWSVADQDAAMAAGVGDFTAADVAFLDEIAETLLPETTTPGAKAAKTGAFMALMVTATYSAAHQQVFRDGMRALEDECRRLHSVTFMNATPAQRLALLAQLDREQLAVMAKRKDPDAPAHYFRMMKQLALLGYFTSEIGCTQAQRYVESPGRFEPCVPYAPGDRTWASHA